MTVHIDSQGRRLVGHLHGPASAKAGILFVHGLHSTQAGYRERAEAAAAELGTHSLTFDLGGHGESEGSRDALSVADHLEDAVAAYDRLAAEVDPARIAAAGASYGGFLAGLLTTRRPVARLAIRAPALYRDADLAVRPAARGRASHPAEARAALDALRAFGGPVLIVESGRDAVIPAAAIRHYRDAAPGAEYVLMKDAAHDLHRPEWRAEFLRALLEFLRGL